MARTSSTHAVGRHQPVLQEECGYGSSWWRVVDHLGHREAVELRLDEAVLAGTGMATKYRSLLRGLCKADGLVRPKGSFAADEAPPKTLYNKLGHLSSESSKYSGQAYWGQTENSAGGHRWIGNFMGIVSVARLRRSPTFLPPTRHWTTSSRRIGGRSSHGFRPSSKPSTSTFSWAAASRRP
ncbi:hypothetical protein MPL3365_130542 [Mesorhizobium plurifarium]|uniref:Uncharacterized protein n=1 Tax=Mesorhizobium plurifarium TaxID=69974 RepID=A0A090GSY9_MESPL|nr:hypothetical protein MPL3365_130542 [Mesorhizobium plurifarium]